MLALLSHVWRVPWGGVREYVPKGVAWERRVEHHSFTFDLHPRPKLHSATPTSHPGPCSAGSSNATHPRCNVLLFHFFTPEPLVSILTFSSPSL